MNLSNENIQLSLIRLRRQIALLDDKARRRKTTSAPGRGTMEASDTEHIYMVVYETSMWGGWTNPRDAVRWLIKIESDDEHTEQLLDEELDKIVEERLRSDYPALIKIPIDQDGEPWYWDR